MTNKLYQCIGENFGFDCRMGHCGDIHTLAEWIALLFPSKVEEAKRYFENYTDTEIVKYLLMNKGKRLKRV